MENIAQLKNEINEIKKELDSLLYGSIETRDSKGKKYIYVHFRNAGILSSKYAGEFSNELIDAILRNNIRAKELKKRLKAAIKKAEAFEKEQAVLNDDIKLNIDLARRFLVDSIYKQSILEGVATTYSDTETLINEGRVHDMNATDVLKIINLKHAWEFIMDYDVECYPTNYDILCQINELVQEGISYTAGKIRSTPVSIGGSSYVSPLPLESKVKEDIESITSSSFYSPLEKASRLIAYAMKAQTFLDGNKRTAVIFGNHYLISHGLGLIVVPVDKLPKYKKLLVEYYEGRSESIIEFFINECHIPLK